MYSIIIFIYLNPDFKIYIFSRSQFKQRKKESIIYVRASMLEFKEKTNIHIYTRSK